MRTKLSVLALLALLFLAAGAVRPPSPVCRVSPIPSQIPVTVGEMLRFDLQQVFSGYNLMLNGTKNEHIEVATKYDVTEYTYPTSYNFSNVKIKPNNRFLGLVIRGDYSGLVVGTNDDTKGVTVNFEVSVENIPNLHCFDMQEVFFYGNSVIVIDCASFAMGQIVYNQFLYVNLTTRTVLEGSHFSDTFVHYNFLSKRKIEVITDPFTRISHLIRFTLRDGVSQQHQDQTYAEIFVMTNPLKPQLLDVIDHTFLQLQKLSIADYQVQYNLIYILAYNKGLYEIRLTPDQAIVVRSRFDIKLDIYKFRVDRLGFNDDLQVVATNGNTIYQFEWDVTTPPVLTNKYILIPGTKVEQIFVDYNFVVVAAVSQWDNEAIRRTWVFTKTHNTYLNAYNVFHAPFNATHIIVWNEHGSTLHIFHNYNAFYVKMSLPYLTLKSVDVTKVNTTEAYEVVAYSTGDDGTVVNCTEKFNFVYLQPGDTRILKTGFWPRSELNVDADDQRDFPLTYEFFGANLSYKVDFNTTSQAKPYYFVNKQHKAVFNWPTEINPANIVYFEMFTQIIQGQIKPEAIYGLVQVARVSESQTLYTTHYVRCKINVFDRDELHHLTCQVVITAKFAMGRIIAASQMFEPKQRRIALIFDSQPHVVYVYYFWPQNFGFFGRKDYAGDAGNQVTGVAIAQRKLFVVLEYGKRVDIFDLDDIQEPTNVPRAARPRMVLNSNVMRFFGVTYFAPVDIKISRFHKQVIFLRTKSGVMALNINEEFFPELLFTVPTQNIRYDFEINHNSLLILTQSTTTFYQLQVPLRRADPPLKKQTIDTKFKIGQYDQVCSDRFFYLVGTQSTYVINPYLRSTSKIYSEIVTKQEILNIDAVNILDMEILFIHTKSEIVAYVFAETPKLTVVWPPNSDDFSMNLTAYNPSTTSEPYSLQFYVIDINQTVIQPTEDFDRDAVRKLGKVKSPKDNKTYSTDISINESTWFNGTILNYQVITEDKECQDSAFIRNHVELSRKVIEARAVYDIQSTVEGIYAQQYSSLLKSYTFNDSIHYISRIPTQRRGEVCSKLAVGEFQQYVVSLCELGTQVNVYITTTVASKPFTFGPYPTDARQVNHAKIVGQILMIVDNSDDPLVRPGGIYLYHLNFDLDDPDFISFLDYIDYQDLQIEGYTGTPFIGSADLHTPFYNVDDEYRLFLTETRTGSIFVFGFSISDDGEEIIYLSKKYIPLSEILPHELRYPTPLRILTINIHYAFDSGKVVDYYLLLSVSNWHHIEIMLSLTHTDDIVAFKLQRLFQRFPWGQLQNYFKYKRGRAYQTYFAVPYVNDEESKQLILIYSVPYIINANADNYKDKYSPHSYRELSYGLDLKVPVIGALGAHQVDDTFETAFAFHTFGNDKMLWSDMHGSDIHELTLYQNITVFIRGLQKVNETIHIIASNLYSNYTFDIDLSFWKDKDDDDDDKKDKKEYLWIVVIGVAGVMIIGLLIVCVKQRKTHRQTVEDQHKQTLLTVQDGYKNDYIDINRSSVDTGSIRESFEPTMPANNLVREPQPEPVPEAAQGEESSSSDEAEQEVQNVTH